MHELIELVEGFGSPRVVLLGDYMLDRYVYGDVERISPEAPVPILKVVRSDFRTGAAGNVARAIIALGGRVACVGAIGDDEAGKQLVELLSETEAETASLVRLRGRPTTIKTRYVGLAQHKNPHQMLRVDEERVDELSEELRRAIRAAVHSELGDRPAVAIQDHNKGLLDEKNTPEIIADARASGCAVIVDPALIGDYRRYRGATLLTPNRYEAAAASGVAITDEKSLEKAAERIVQVTEADAVARDYGFKILDLFCWEQRMGNWQAMSQTEWDIVQEVFTPFNCRELLTTLLAVDLKFRKEPNYRLYREIINTLWNDVLSEPINPISRKEKLVRTVKVLMAKSKWSWSLGQYLSHAIRAMRRR